MQKGFASAEIIFVVMMIAILVTVAVPKATRFVDTAAVDYEQKRMYSELQFARTLNRSAAFSTKGLNGATNFLSTKMNNSIPATFYFDRNENSFQILRDEKPIRETHNLSNGVTFSTDITRIIFDTSGYADVKSKTVTLTSRRGYERKIVIDSVGRIRGGDDDY